MTFGNLKHEELLRVLHYDPCTGIFTWKVDVGNIRAGTVASSVDGKGYYRINYNYNCYRQHRLAWFYVYMVWPEGCIDHKDRNIKNNQISNLWDCSLSQNQWNRVYEVNHRSGLPTGVSLEKRTGRFVARINANTVKKHLGTFDTADEAKRAYEAAKAKRESGCPI